MGACRLDVADHFQGVGGPSTIVSHRKRASHALDAHPGDEQDAGDKDDRDASSQGDGHGGNYLPVTRREISACRWLMSAISSSKSHLKSPVSGGVPPEDGR